MLNYAALKKLKFCELQKGIEGPFYQFRVNDTLEAVFCLDIHNGEELLIVTLAKRVPADYPGLAEYEETCTIEFRLRNENGTMKLCRKDDKYPHKWHTYESLEEAAVVEFNMPV